MNIIDFYTNQKPGRTIQDIIALSDDELESDHSWVQWAFPLTEPSKYNLDAPILSPEDIRTLSKDKSVQDNFTLITNRFVEFLQNSDHWISRNNHNFLRITRAIKCLKLLRLNNQLKTFVDFLCPIVNTHASVIGDVTINFWMDALDPKFSLIK